MDKMSMAKKVVIGCAILLVAVIVAVMIFKVSFGSLFYIGLFALCPLMHIFMMRDGKHKH